VASKYAHLRVRAEKDWISGDRLVDISTRLNLNKSTVWYWVKDLERPHPKRKETCKNNPALAKAQRKAAAATKKKWAEWRARAYDEACKEAPLFFQDPLFRDYVMLYLTEGFRRTRNEVSVGNSNPALVKLAYWWVQQHTTKPEKKIRFTLQIHKDQDEKQVKRFWAKALQVSSRRIKTIRKSNSGQLKGRKWRSQHGVLTVAVSDTWLRSKIQAWMDHLEEEWNKHGV